MSWKRLGQACFSICSSVGAGVQRVALQTTDIFGASHQACANRLPVLPVPPNFYDDVRARLGLTRLRQVSNLRNADLFYDRDENGEYFDFKSRAFEKRFFFDIVQRTGYAGYGFANARVRLASQARYKSNRLN